LKVVIDLIEAIREEIQNQGEYIFLAMLLKENDGGEMQLVGEKAISKVDIIDNQLLFIIEVEEKTVCVEPILKLLNALKNEEMMMKVGVLVSNQIFDVVGFGKSIKDKKFVVFIESK
jgi:hypothetical protein